MNEGLVSNGASQQKLHFVVQLVFKKNTKKDYKKRSPATCQALSVNNHFVFNKALRR
jgi:hypothetical protein